MASVQDLKRRIKSIRNTRKITKAMELVASARLRRAQARIEAMRPYADRMMELMVGTARASSSVRGLPLLQRRKVDQRSHRRELGRVISGQGLVSSVAGDEAAAFGDHQPLADVADCPEERSLACRLKREVAIEEVLAEVGEDRQHQEGDGPGDQLGRANAGEPQAESDRHEDERRCDTGDHRQKPGPPPQPVIFVGPSSDRVGC